MPPVKQCPKCGAMVVIKKILNNINFAECQFALLNDHPGLDNFQCSSSNFNSLKFNFMVRDLATITLNTYTLCQGVCTIVLH